MILMQQLIDTTSLLLPSIGRSENISMTQFSPFEDEVRHGIVHKTFHPKRSKSVPNQTGWPNLATLTTNEGRTCFE